MRQMVPEDWESVRSIYLEGLATGDATFETEAPSWEKWDESHLSVSRLVAVSPSEDGVVGWAALERVSSRAVYGIVNGIWRDTVLLERRSEIVGH